MAGRLRTQRLAQRPNFVNTREAAEAGTLYGTPDEVSAKLQPARPRSEYVLLNSAGGIASLRRFAHELCQCCERARAPDRGLRRQSVL